MQTKLNRELTTEKGIIDNSLLKVDLTKELGRGGFGVVYKGKYRGRDAAVKELLVKDFSPSAQEEFESESKIMLQLRDPSVVHLYGVTQEKPYRMVLEYCSLGSLDRYLQKKKIEEVSWEVRFHFATSIASGVQYLHSYNPIIIHGDLKSLNVLLTGDPLRPDTKLADFGMSKLKTETQSKIKTSHADKGWSVQWAAPELFSLNSKKTKASDMYAFAMTLWEIASHEYPYSSCSIGIICAEVKAGERAEIPSNIPPLFEKAIKDCWAQKPEDRPSAKVVLDHLQAYESTPQAEEMIQSNTESSSNVKSAFVRSSSHSSGSSSSPVVSKFLDSSGMDVISKGAFSSRTSNNTVLSSTTNSTTNVNSSMHNSGISDFSSDKMSSSPLFSAKRTRTDSGNASPTHSSRSFQSRISVLSREDKVQKSFFQAAKVGDQNKLSAYVELLDDGLATQDSEGNTVLHHAAANGHLELIKWLIKEQNMNASVHNQEEEPPLLLAARNGKQTVVEWLIQSGEVDPGERNAQQQSALLLAAQQGHLGLVAWLLETGMFTITEKDKQQNTVFSSSKEIVVLWANLYRNLLRTSDPAKDGALEKVDAYQGENAALLQFAVLKTLIHFGSKQLLTLYQVKINRWWSNFTDTEKSVLSMLAESKQLVTWLFQQKEQPTPKISSQLKSHSMTSTTASVHLTSASNVDASFTLSGFGKVLHPASPTISEPALLTSAQQVEAASQAVQDKINANDLEMLLEWVPEGHLEEVEKLLKKNSSLALGTGTITDRSNRTFNNITALQYAVWALDTEMAKLIMEYVGASHSAVQMNALVESPQVYSIHGASYDVAPLVNKYQTYRDNYKKWDDKKYCEYWQKEIGGEQRKCPAWLIYAWSEEGEDVAWTKQDPNRKIKREYDKHRLHWWFTENYNNGRGVGSSWACVRGKFSKTSRCFINGIRHNWNMPTEYIVLDRDHDSQCVSDFGMSHHKTLERLRTIFNRQLSQTTSRSTADTASSSGSMTNVNSSVFNSGTSGFTHGDRAVTSNSLQASVLHISTTSAQQVETVSKAVEDKIDQKELSALLKWVTEGHLEKVEERLKKKPMLSLGTGRVTDLSDRTFNDITVLQYAAWALDVEMVELIIQYAGVHHSAVQMKALAESPQVYSHYGASYEETLLVNKYETYFANSGNWSIDERKDYWQKEIGGEQWKCPAWLIYAWSEEGNDVSWTKQDMNRKVKREYDKPHLTRWFTGSDNEGLGITWAAGRGEGSKLLDSQLPEALWREHLVVSWGLGAWHRHDQKCITDLAMTRRGTLRQLRTDIENQVNQNTLLPAQVSSSSPSSSGVPTTARTTAETSMTASTAIANVTSSSPPLFQLSGVPSIFHPASSSSLTYSQQVESASKKAIQDKMITQGEVDELLKWVTEGHLEKVEERLKKKPTLALGTGTITDRSHRAFNHITVLQYAAWALDLEMVELIIQYAGANHSAIQLKALEEEPKRYSQHDAHYDAMSLLNKYQTHFDNYRNWDNSKRCQYWQKEIGGEQRKCPAWLIYAWTEEGADVAWTKQDVKRKIKREYDNHRLDWWFTGNYNNGKGVGSTWAAYRLAAIHIQQTDYIRSYSRPYDSKYVFMLVTTRRETLQRLKANLDSQVASPRAVTTEHRSPTPY